MLQPLPRGSQLSQRYAALHPVFCNAQDLLRRCNVRAVRSGWVGGGAVQGAESVRRDACMQAVGADSAAFGGRGHRTVPAARLAARHPLGPGGTRKALPLSATGALATCSRRLRCRRAAARSHRSRPRQRRDPSCAPHRTPRVSRVPWPLVSPIHALFSLRPPRLTRRICCSPQACVTPRRYWRRSARAQLERSRTVANAKWGERPVYMPPTTTLGSVIVGCM